VVAHLHVEAVAAPGDGFADAAQADDAEVLAADPRAQRNAAMHLAPLAGAHEAVALRHAAGARNQQAPGQVGHAIGEHIGGVADQHATLAGGIDVDGFVTHAPAADRLEIGQRVDQRGIRAEIGRGDQRGDALAMPGQRGRTVGLLPQFEHIVFVGESPIGRRRSGQGAYLDDAVLGGHVV